MPKFEFRRVERVIGTWEVEAATIEEAREKWERLDSDIDWQDFQVVDVLDAWWTGEDGTRYGETAEDDQDIREWCDDCSALIDGPSRYCESCAEANRLKAKD